jgi:hypothetical protein
MEEQGRRGYRSLFWPVVLIGIGVIALLFNMKVLSRDNIVVLARLWPLLLILIGIDLLFGRRAPALGALIGIAAIALIVGLMLAGPSLGWSDAAEVKTELFSEPMGAATSARVNLGLSSDPTEVMALPTAENLIEAELTHTGEIEFDVEGDREKSISLRRRGGVAGFWFDWFDRGDEELRWDIRLSPQLPLDLQIDAGSGSADLDLSALQLTALALDVGSGSVEAQLPSTDSVYEAQVDGGSGSCRLSFAEGADVDMEADVGSGSVNVEIGDAADVSLRANGGSGSLTIAVPAGAAVRLDVRDSGSGSVNVPGHFDRTERGDDDEGTWETPGFGAAEHRIEIVIEDVGSGSINVRER